MPCINLKPTLSNES